MDISVTYLYTCRNIINTIKTSGHSSLEKYTSHFIRKGYERVIVWEVSWRLNKDCNILTPTLLAIAAFLSRSPGLLNRGPLRGLVLTPRTDLQLIWTSCRAGLYNYSTSTCFLWASHLHSIQLVDSQGYPLISSTGCTCYIHRCISRLTAWPGRRSTCYISSDKLVRLHPRKLRHWYKRKSQEKNWNSSNSSWKQRHKD